MRTPTLLHLLWLLRVRPEGIDREKLAKLPEVERALAELVRVGLVVEREGRVLPQPRLRETAEKMDRLYRRLHQDAAARELVMTILRPK